MAKWNYYRVDMDLKGRMTQMPDSQKIFGAMIHRMAQNFPSEQVTELVAKQKSGRASLAVSNLLPRGYVPVPYSALVGRLGEDNEEINPNRKMIYKELKKRSYVKINQLDLWLKEPVTAKDVFPYVNVVNTQQIHASIDSKRYDLPGLDPNLYSVPEVIVNEVQSTKVHTIHEFMFYIAIEQETDGMRLLKVLESAKDEGRTFVLGPRGSQGMNTFQVHGIHQDSVFTSDQEGYYLNLGMLLPGKIDFGKSSLKLFTSERRPFNPPGGWDEGNHKQFISFIEAGSIIYAPNGIESAGHSIQSPFHPRDIVFGNALLYALGERRAR